MAINSTIDDGGDDRYGEWEGGPIEVGPVKRAAAPDPTEHLDQEIAKLEAEEPQPGDDTPEIADEGIAPFHQEDSEQLLGQEVAELEAGQPFDFQKAASESTAPEVGEVDTDDSSPPESLGDYLKSISTEEADSGGTEEKPLSARQKRGMSRVPGGNPQPEEGVGMGSMDQQGSANSQEDADIRNRDTMAKGQIDHMRRIEEITERLIAART